MWSTMIKTVIHFANLSARLDNTIYNAEHVKTRAGWIPLYDAIGDGFGDIRKAFIEDKKVWPIKTKTKMTTRNIITKISPPEISLEIDVNTRPTWAENGIKRNGKTICEKKTDIYKIGLG